MFKLVVLSVLLAVVAAAPKPGLLAAAPYAYAAPALAIPSAVSHTSRVDIHSKPVIATTYAAAPLAYSAHVAAPLAYSAHVAAPLAYSAHVAPLAYSHLW